MSLSSLFRKNNKQETPDDDNSFSRAADEPKPKRARARRKSASEDEANDPVLPEKKRARRRLIGAVTLVLAAVIGLPMVLDAEPKPIAHDIDIRIPSKDQSPVPRRVPQADALDPSEQIIEPADAAADTHAPVMPSAPTATTGAQKISGSSQQGNAATAAPAERSTPVVTKTQAVDKPGPAAKPASSSDKLAAAETHGAAKSESKSSSKPEAHDKDVKSSAKPSASSDRETERAMAILEGKGSAKQDAAKSASDNKSGKYSIQVAALSSQDKVNELRAKLKAAGIASQTQKVPTASGERIRVRVGPFASKEEAEKMRARLVKLGLNGSLVPLGE
ncbi:DedD protein [Paucimonas lemoignei]|uniref:DedD protein n=1 Tax=Paucimonas lemoignei TaxID=29443 RepID=A0A4R3I3I6_PAULE|nr:SPOR domain-containing protein [Paucimonas lemoignei]TCS39613.1 DedD protein [Paucimonas lemoignei]